MSIKELLEQRRSTRFFDPTKKIPDETITKLLSHAELAPSGFNLQPWRFLVVQDRRQKEKLFKCAWQQQKILDASSVIILCGDTNSYKNAEEVSNDMVEKGYFPKEAQHGWIKLVNSVYRDPKQARDAVMRDVMLTGAVIMLAAMEHGINTAPMSGFDEKKLIDSFSLPKSIIPVLLIALGYSRKAPLERATRTSIEKLTCYDKWDLKDLK